MTWPSFRSRTMALALYRATSCMASAFAACGDVPRASRLNFRLKPSPARARASLYPRRCHLALHSPTGQSGSGNMERNIGLTPDWRDTPIRILIVDDHPVVLAGLTSMLGTQAGIKVLGSASSGAEALEMLHAKQADLLLLD